MKIVICRLVIQRADRVEIQNFEDFFRIFLLQFEPFYLDCINGSFFAAVRFTVKLLPNEPMTTIVFILLQFKS